MIRPSLDYQSSCLFPDLFTPLVIQLEFLQQQTVVSFVKCLLFVVVIICDNRFGGSRREFAMALLTGSASKFDLNFSLRRLIHQPLGM